MESSILQTVCWLDSMASKDNVCSAAPIKPVCFIGFIKLVSSQYALSLSSFVSIDIWVSMILASRGPVGGAGEKADIDYRLLIINKTGTDW